MKHRNSAEIAFRKLIRDRYQELLPFIEKYYPHFDTYIFELNWFMTPIEKNIWDLIKLVGIPIKCPQFPVGKYFLDFADPIKKIGIEVDGKEWHRDYLKDSKRQKEIEDWGWVIVRIEGSETYNEEAERIIIEIRDEVYKDNFYHKKSKLIPIGLVLQEAIKDIDSAI